MVRSVLAHHRYLCSPGAAIVDLSRRRAVDVSVEIPSLALRYGISPTLSISLPYSLSYAIARRSSPRPAEPPHCEPSPSDAPTSFQPPASDFPQPSPSSPIIPAALRPLERPRPSSLTSFPPRTRAPPPLVAREKGRCRPPNSCRSPESNSLTLTNPSRPTQRAPRPRARQRIYQTSEPAPSARCALGRAT